MNPDPCKSLGVVPSFKVYLFKCMALASGFMNLVDRVLATGRLPNPTTISRIKKEVIRDKVQPVLTCT